MIIDLHNLDAGEAVIGPIVVRPNIFRNAGERIEAHRHRFDHATLIIKGAFRVGVDGHFSDLRAGEGMNIPAGAEHEMQSLAPDSELWCVFPATGRIEDSY